MSTSTSFMASRPGRHPGMAPALCALLLGAWIPHLQAQATPEPAPAPAAPPPASEYPAWAAPPAAPPPSEVSLSYASEAPLPGAEPAQDEGKPADRERTLMSFTYSMGIPMGDLHDFVGKLSFRGTEFTALWPVYHALYLGPSVGYNLFHEDKTRQTYQVDSGAVTAKLYRDANFWTAALALRYFFMQPKSIVRPWLGLRTGMAAVSASTLVADFSKYDNPVGFLVAPEAGVMLRFNDRFLGSIAYQYNYTTASMHDFSSLSYGTAQLSLVLRFQ